LPLSYNGRYLAETDGERGTIRVVADAATKRLLGVHMIGGDCSELIWGAAELVQREATIDEIAQIVYPHPTVSEIFGDAVSQVR
jgi:dihydrolipoamide dehydrogenase